MGKYEGNVPGCSSCVGCILPAEDISYHGNNVVYGFQNIKPSLSECVKSCKLNENCKFFSFEHKDGLCFLKDGRTRHSKKNLNGYTYGPRDCDIASIPKRLENNLPMKEGAVD